MYPKNECTEIRSRNADAEAEKAEAGSPLKCKTQRLAATVEAAGTLSGDQPLVEAKENSKYKTQRLSATVEAAGTVSGDQPLADVAKETPHKENSKYDTPKLTDTGTDASRTSIIKSRSQMVLARIN